MDIRETILGARSQHQQNIIKGFVSNETPDDIEKAINRQVGDVHSNGKWVWTQLPSGKYDWRVITVKKQVSDKAPEKKEDSSKQAPTQKVQTDSIASLESKVPGYLIMKERKEFVDAKLDLEDWEKEKITPQNKSGYDAAQKSLAEAAKKYREALNVKLQDSKIQSAMKTKLKDNEDKK